MSNVAALKKKATDFEQRKQLDKAIAAYREILDIYDAGGDEQIDVGLYNRVADLLLRQGSTPEAVSLFERAVDLYSEGGFFNNAIALCNKILRTSPGRASVYYKLGKISAAKGFKSDAKQNFLEYADRMQKAGEMQEAFRALKEFADLCPDQDDIRLLLAEQLTKADKKSEALEQLQLLYTRYNGEGRTTEAQATVERMRAIDPDAKIESTAPHAKVKVDDDLVFLDLNAPASTRGPRRSLSVPRQPTADPSLPLIIYQEPPTAPAPAAAVPDGPIAGLEHTMLGDSATRSRTPLPASEFAQLDLGAIQEAPTSPRPIDGLALAGELPKLNASDTPESVWSDFKMIEPTPAAGDVIVARSDIAAPDPAALLDLTPLDIEPTAMAGPTSVTGADAAAAAAIERPRTPDSTPVPVEKLAAEAPATAIAYGTVPDERVAEPPPVRRSVSTLAASVGSLAARLADDPENAPLRREYAEALLESGDRDTGLRELERALIAFEQANKLDEARALADEIIRLKPSSVRHHQKRVEYAVRTNDKSRLVEAYAELADALFRDGQTERAKTVYERVIEISPEDMRAHAALEAYEPEDEAAQEAARAEATPPAMRRTTPRTPIATPIATPVAAPVASAGPPPQSDDDGDYVSLGDWLRAEEGPRSTRMVVEEEEPSGDEQKDFHEMLKKFKQGVAANVEEEDHASHYDLGVAYKEMGLLDEAIAQFQKAARGPTHRVRTYEALGQCLLEKKQLPVAVSILQRALHEPGVGDDQLVGVLYLLGYINESLAKHTEAKGFYERVFGVDIEFRDVGERLANVEKALA